MFRLERLSSITLTVLFCFHSIEFLQPVPGRAGAPAQQANYFQVNLSPARGGLTILQDGRVLIWRILPTRYSGIVATGIGSLTQVSEYEVS